MGPVFYSVCFFRTRPLQSTSITSRLSSISAAPPYPRGSSVSPATVKATIPENTGSSVKITPT